MTDFKAIGRPTKLIDGRVKVMGATRFTADLVTARCCTPEW
jgi:CO/xanthine dehydrogenase Mo-binding subunit